MGLIILAFVLGLAGIALLALSETHYSKYKHKKVNCCSVVEGVIFKYRHKDGQKVPQVKYQVDNLSYTIYSRNPFTEELPVGSTIQVFYNPKDPKESYLLKLTRGLGLTFAIILGALFLLTSVVILVMHFI